MSITSVDIKELMAKATANNVAAQAALGRRYQIGAGVKTDYQEAYKWLKQSAEQGNGDGQAYYGKLFGEGLGGIKKSLETAVEWYQKSAAQGNAKGQFYLGGAYFFGEGISKNEMHGNELCRLALDGWYQKAAEQGNPEAQTVLGCMYSNGLGVAKDAKQACKWFRKAAEQGAASAQTNLGVAYSNGRGVEKNKKLACKWYRKAAEQGLAGAQHNLGVMCAKGQGVVKDEKQACEWFRKAAEQGNAEAQFNYAVMCAESRGTVENEKQAIEWFHKVAEQGNRNLIARLKVYLSNVLSLSIGEEYDVEETIDFCNLAIKIGMTEALFKLGKIYEKEPGRRSPDLFIARDYYLQFLQETEKQDRKKEHESKEVIEASKKLKIYTPLNDILKLSQESLSNYFDSVNTSDKNRAPCAMPNRILSLIAEYSVFHPVEESRKNKG